MFCPVRFWLGKQTCSIMLRQNSKTLLRSVTTLVFLKLVLWAKISNFANFFLFHHYEKSYCRTKKALRQRCHLQNTTFYWGECGMSCVVEVSWGSSEEIETTVWLKEYPMKPCFIKSQTFGLDERVCARITFRSWKFELVTPAKHGDTNNNLSTQGP